MNIFEKIKNMPRNIKYGIENLVRWFPVIWKDRNWDHAFIYIILKHKLYLTEQLIRNYGIHIKNIEDADKIKTCILLLDRLIKDEYHENVSKKYYKRWGHPKFNWIEKNEKYSELEINHKNVKTEEDQKQEKKDFHRICKLENRLRKQDIRYLFNMMCKHIEGWWD